MTDTTNTDTSTTETTEAAADDLSTTEATDTSTETVEETDATEETEQQDNRPEPEAKKYRKRAQDAEAERDTLRTRLDAMLKVEASHLIESERHTLHNPADLFEFGGATVADLQDEHGMIDPAKVTAALDDLRNTRPYLFKDRFGAGNAALRAAAGDREPMRKSTNWQKALKR